jgi:integrase
MATFIPELSNYKRHDGTYAVNVRIYHNGVTLRKALGMHAKPNQLNREKTKIKDAALLDAANKAVDRIRMVAATVEGAAFMDAVTLWRKVTERMEAQNGFLLPFVAFSQTITAKMEKGTADGYKYAINAFKSFLGREEIDVNEIDKAMVSDFRAWIEKRNGKGCRAASAYLEKLRHVHNVARDTYNDDDTGLVRIPRQPFRGMVPPQPPSRHRALTLEQIRKVVEAQPVTRRGRLAKDVFLLSFCLIGMNTADMYGLKKADLNDGIITYQRRKTKNKRADKAEIAIRVEPEAYDLLNTWKGTKLLLSFAERYCDYKGFNKAANTGLKAVGEAVGITKLQTYSARHTWATLARNECGVPKDVVHEALDHASRGGERVTDIYIRRDFGRVWEANRKVLDLVFGGC